ncbi:MAG: AMP-binding protein [Actinomycetota bacterium]
MATLTSQHASERGDTSALIDETRSTTWSKLDDRVNRLVNGLRDRGLAAGDTIAVVAGNQCEWFELAQACAHGGWTYVPVNWHWVADELAYVFGDAQAKAVFVDERFTDTVVGALQDSRSDKVELVVGIRSAAESTLRTDSRFVEYEEVVDRGDQSEPENQVLGGPMFYTSGTTGRPKGVRGALSGGSSLTPDIMRLVAAGFSNFVPIPGRTLLCGPFYHSAQWAFSFLPMINGSSVVMQHKYDSAGVLDLIDRHECTNIHLVPTQMKRLVDLPSETKDRFSGASLVVAWHGAAPCPPAVKRSLIDWWGPKVTEYYGSTEGSIISVIPANEWLAKGGSVGRPLESVEVIVVDDNGDRVPQGAEGTLYFRNKMGTDFSYHNDDEKTRAAHLEPGVFTTGDVGYIDADGYLWLSDRKIDMIISGGVNIYPAEIEGALSSHPSVEDVAVIGVPDDEFGESVKALVQLVPGTAGDEILANELIAHCRVLLAGYKAPRSVDFVDHIPRTGTGKIQKAPLRAPYWVGRDRRI